MRRAIKVLLSASIFYQFSAGVFGPIYAIFVERIGGNILTASTAWSVYSIIVGILIIIFGKLEDKLNRRKMVVLGYLLSAIGVAGYIFVTNPLHLYLVQAILGVSTAVGDPSWNAIYSKSLSKGRESSEWAYWEGSISIVWGIAAVIGGIIATLFGFRVLFALMAVSCGISTVVSTFLLRRHVWEELLKI